MCAAELWQAHGRHFSLCVSTSKYSGLNTAETFAACLATGGLDS